MSLIDIRIYQHVDTGKISSAIADVSAQVVALQGKVITMSQQVQDLRDAVAKLEAANKAQSDKIDTTVVTLGEVKAKLDEVVAGSADLADLPAITKQVQDVIDGMSSETTKLSDAEAAADITPTAADPVPPVDTGPG